MMSDHSHQPLQQAELLFVWWLSGLVINAVAVVLTACWNCRCDSILDCLSSILLSCSVLSLSFCVY